MLNTLSKGTLVPQIQRYLFDNFAREGKCFCSFSHRNKGSISTSTGGYSSFRLISYSTLSTAGISSLLDGDREGCKIAAKPLAFSFGGSSDVPSSFSHGDGIIELMTATATSLI